MSDVPPPPPPDDDGDDPPAGRHRSGAPREGISGVGPPLGWFRRVGAAILDGAIWLIPNFAADEIGGRDAGLIFTTVSFGVYLTIMLAWKGQTLGYIAVGARVQTAGGDRLSYGRSFVRWAAQFVLAAPVFLVTVIPAAVLALIVPFLVDCLWPLWDRSNRTLHDIVAGTVVVQVE